MLIFRLNELNDVVEKFIIVESVYTFKGDKKTKPLLDISALPFQDKIISFDWNTITDTRSKRSRELCK